jgi:phosphatidylcholine synthase
MLDPTPVAGTTRQRVLAYAVHVYTASGVALAFIAAAELCAPAPREQFVFALLFGAVLIDATDGFFARRWDVHRYAPRIDGRTIDDLVDYLTYTFIPLLLIWRAGWLPAPP